MKRFLLGMVAAAAAMGLSATASANSITLEFEGGGTEVTLSGTGAALVVVVYANFTDVGGGAQTVATDLVLDSGLTPTACKEKATQAIGAGATNATWGRFDDSCKGIDGQQVRLMEQELKGGAPSTAGTIRLGTVTFTVGGFGTMYVNPLFDVIFDGFGGDDQTTRAPTSQGGVTVHVNP